MLQCTRKIIPLGLVALLIFHFCCWCDLIQNRPIYEPCCVSDIQIHILQLWTIVPKNTMSPVTAFLDLPLIKDFERSWSFCWRTNSLTNVLVRILNSCKRPRRYFIWYKVFKNGPSKICARKPLKIFTWSIFEYFFPYVVDVYVNLLTI